MMSGQSIDAILRNKFRMRLKSTAGLSTRTLTNYMECSLLIKSEPIENWSYV